MTEEIRELKLEVDSYDALLQTLAGNLKYDLSDLEHRTSALLHLNGLLQLELIRVLHQIDIRIKMTAERFPEPEKTRG